MHFPSDYPQKKNDNRRGYGIFNSRSIYPVKPGNDKFHKKKCHNSKKAAAYGAYPALKLQRPVPVSPKNPVKSVFQNDRSYIFDRCGDDHTSRKNDQRIFHLTKQEI